MDLTFIQLLQPVTATNPLYVFIMRKGIGFLIVLYGLSIFFDTAFVALDSAARESLQTIEAAAIKTQIELEAN